MVAGPNAANRGQLAEVMVRHYFKDQGAEVGHGFITPHFSEFWHNTQYDELWEVASHDPTFYAIHLGDRGQLRWRLRYKQPASTVPTHARVGLEERLCVARIQSVRGPRRLRSKPPHGVDPTLSGARESLKLSYFLFYRTQRIKPRSKRDADTKPMSVYQNYLTLRRVFRERGQELPPSGAVQATQRGLIKRWIARNGIEALRTRRVEPKRSQHASSAWWWQRHERARTQ